MNKMRMFEMYKKDFFYKNTLETVLQHGVKV